MIQRYNWIDRAKGFAILLVVMGHIYFFSFEQSSSVVSRFISSFHMPLFMFLSGYVVSRAVESPFWCMDDLLKRILRLLLPMFVFGVLFTFSYSHVESLSDVWGIICGFINSPAKNGYWYLMSLSVFYVSLQLFRINTNRLVVIYVLIAILVFISFFVGWKFFAQTKDPFCLLNCGNFYLFFICGVFSRKYGFLDIIKRNNWIYSVALIGYLVLFNVSTTNGFVESFLIHMIIPLCAVVVVVCILYERENCNSFIERRLSYIGTHTLDIYVLHYFIVSNVKLSLLDDWLEKNGNVFLSVLITLFLSVIITFVSIYIGKILHKSKFIEVVTFGRIDK